jgi:hypothetical protein
MYVLEIMYDAGIPGKLIRLVRSSIKDTEAEVKFQTRLNNLKKGRALNKVMDWPQLYVTWLLNMSS